MVPILCFHGPKKELVFLCKKSPKLGFEFHSNNMLSKNVYFIF